MYSALKSKIQKRKANIAVIGLGYVGLPLAVNFAKTGYNVVGLDTDIDRVNKVNTKKNYILDVAQKDLSTTVDKGRLTASTNFSLLKMVDIVIICVPTPLRRKYTPDIKYIETAVRSICKNFKKNSLVILESTTYPGTTEELILPLLSKGGRKLDRDFYLSFSPERIDPGNKHYDVTKITKVVGGVTEKSGELTKLLYEKIITKIHVVSSSKVAEMTKLLENTFRIINIGWVNEIALMCDKMNIDIWEVIEAAKTKPFGYMPFYPGLGVGGHCIPDDPLYLYWKAKHHGFSSKFIKLSADINSAMPEYAVERVKKMLKRKSLKGAKLLVIGATYKKDVHDLRKSPSLKVIELLQDAKAVVDYHDPIIPYLKIGDINTVSIPLNSKTLPKYDCVLLTVDHTKLNYSLILKHAKKIFDVKNVFGRYKSDKVVKF